MKKSTLFMILALVLSMAIGLTGTLAYLTDTDADVNVMTLGNVDIEQIELERTEQTNDPDAELKSFTQNKPLYPAVGDADWVTDENGNKVFQKWPYAGSSALFDAEKLHNVQDKFVFVENTGKSDAYVRTIFAFEIGSFDVADIKGDKLIHLNNNDKNSSETNAGHWAWTWLETPVEIDGSNYAIVEAIYLHKSSVQGTAEEGILPVGATSYPSLLQVYLDPKATNEDCEALDGNGNGTYDILVVSQAVQVQGFTDAQTALDEAFGPITTTNHPWLGVAPNDAPTKLNVVNTPEDTLNSLLKGEDIYAEEGTDDELIIETNEAISLDANGAKVVLNGSAREGEEKTYAYLGFVPPAGEDIAVSNLTVTGTGFVELGHYGVGGGDYVADNLKIQNLASTLAIGNNGNTLAPAFSQYGNATLNNCVMTGATAADASATAYDAAFINSTVTNINGGEYGKIYVYEHAKVTIKDAKVDLIESYAMVKNGWGQLVIGEGAVVDTINLNKTSGIYDATLTIEPGATVGQINYDGVTYTQAEWMALQ